MRYAEVAVNSPAAQRRSFSYSIPPGLSVDVGHLVRVPFGSRLLDGVVVELTDFPAVEETKEIESVVDERPALTRSQVSLARWISEYYLSPLFDAVSLMLPPGSERQSLTFLSLATPQREYDSAALTEEQRTLIARVGEVGRVNLKEIVKTLGKRKATSAVSGLVTKGIIVRAAERAPSRAKPRVVEHISLATTTNLNSAMVATPPSKRQAALIRFLEDRPGPVPWPEVKRAAGTDRAALNALTEKGIVSIHRVPVTRDPLAGYAVTPSLPLVLTRAQSIAFQAIASALGREAHEPPSVFLLNGVTGSGKTEVYLQALAEAIKIGKRGIVLVPEISLTPQTIARFASRFPKRVAVLHSRLSPGQHFDEWQRVRNGEFDVVIGARSALFAPQPDLGLIIIDEEHEWTYKQQDKLPRYHTREAAIKLAELAGATVVLGSATPDITTFYRAKRGVYRLLELPERVTPFEGAPFPDVEIVDMREELKAGNSGLFSRSLRGEISAALAAGDQVILYLNRRGAATLVQCRRCGFVMKCRRCEVSLTYHSDTDRLVCHQCNYQTRAPGTCPRCLTPRIKYLGAGTQRLEEEARKAFAPARVLRWDSDVTRARDSHQAILSTFLAHEADILIGTQMITKGLDVPAVTVVGVINADTGLNLPDFRAEERTFQLLSQVAGRAGRGPGGGRVVFQTYTPEDYAIRAAAKHDYRLFYDREIAYRRQLNYPPFSQLASLVFSHANEGICQKEAEALKKQIELRITSRGIPGVGVIGPAPAFIRRLRGRFRWQLVLRGTRLSAFMAEVPLTRGWTLDINPVGIA